MSGLLLADIGGSSSRWAVLTDDTTTVLTAAGAWPGFNPATGSGEELVRTLTAERSAFIGLERAHLYAAGCGTPDRATLLRTALQPVLPGTHIEVHSDLLAAARALWGRGPGAAMILGTGMNAGLYDGTSLTRTLPSLGYILGDEGSGADLGRCLFRDAFRDHMPPEVREAVFGVEGPDLPSTIRGIYRSAFPAKALAEPVARLAEHLDRSYVQRLLADRFTLLAEELKRTLGSVEVRATGAVAFGFRKELTSALQGEGLRLTQVERDPLEGLVRYYRATR
ncbi:MAG: hypothetical protein KA352_10060 [Flavobacteriales bacterium]|nr:hypothetical protein [Flavobacteriales bacterium]